MTKAQENKINEIKREVIKQWVRDDSFEVKRFEVQDLKFFVSVIVEVGLKGDEGTYAEIFGRHSAHIFIGKKGGLSYINKKGKNKNLKHINLWEVHCAQNN